MKYLIILTLITSQLLNCMAQVVESFDSEKNNDTIGVNSEFLDWYSFKIDGKLDLVCKTKDLFELLGKPDSLIVPDFDNICASYFERKFQYAYFRESEVEVYDDTAVVTSINFERQPELELISGDFILNNKTTISALKKHFPICVSKMYSRNVYGLGKLKCLMLPLSKVYSDDSLLLFFRKGKLVRLDYFIEC